MRLFLALSRRQALCGSAVLLLVVGLFLVRSAPRAGLSAQEVGKRAQDELKRTASYRFELTIHSLIDGQEAMVSQVEGEFVRPDSYHLRGKSYDYPLEVYQLGRRVFFQDPADGEWKQAQGGPNLVTEAVDLGTSPLIDFLRSPSFELLGRERIGDVVCYHLRSSLSEVANPYWRVFFSDFLLDGWIDRTTFKLHQLELTGSNRAVPGDKLQIKLRLTDHDAPITITLPPPLQLNP